MRVFRFLRHLMIFLGGGGLVLFLGRQAYPLLEMDEFSFLFPKPLHLEPHQSFKREPIFQVESDKAILFPFSRPSLSTVRIVCHSDIDFQDLHKTCEAPFTVLVEVLGAKGQILQSLPYTFKSILSGEKISGQRGDLFYENSTDIPTLRHVIEMNLDHLKARSIRLKLLSKDSFIKHVWVTVMEPHLEADRNLLSSWYRLPESDQISLSRGGAYPIDTLTSRERKNLIRHIYSPLGPSGIEGKNYTQRNLCVIQSKEDKTYPSTPYQGFFTDNNHEAVIPLPGAENPVTLNITHANPDDKTPITLRLIWYGKGPRSQEDFYATLPKNVFTYQRTFGEGSLHVSSVQPTFINMGATKEVQDNKPASVTYYQLAESPVIFDVSGHGELENIVRISSLCILNAGNSGLKEKIVSYAVLDARSQKILSGTWKIPFDTNAVGQDKTIAIPQGLDQSVVFSQKIDHFLSIPPEGKTLLLNADETVFASAHNTLTEGLRTFKIPDDAYSFGSPDMLSRGNWYGLTPLNNKALLFQKRGLFFSIQSQPKIDDPFVDKGIYRWDTFMPQNVALSRYILMQEPEEMSFRLRGLDVYFTSISPNMPIQVDFQYRQGEEILQPRLLFIKKGQDFSPFSLKLDGEVVLQDQLRGSSGEVLLPPVKAGSHTLELIGEHPVFINYIKPGPEHYIQKKTLYWTEGELVIPVSKHALEEIIGVTILTLPQDNHRKVMDVEIQGPSLEKGKLFKGYTVRKRRYNIGVSNTQNKAFLIDADEQELHMRPAFFIKVGEDLWGKEYRIILKPKGRIPMYLIVSRVIPGWQKERRFNVEGVTDSVE